jgi:hypothetical protein
VSAKDSGRSRLRQRFAARVALAAVVLATVPAGAQELVQPLSVAGWEGGAYKRPDGRPLCALWDEYAEGVGLWLGWDETGFYIDVVDPRLGLEPDRIYKATLQIDDIWGGTAEGYAITNDTLAITFGEDEAAIGAFRRGRKLYLQEIGRSYTLNGTRDAVAALMRCYHAVK